MTCLLDIDGVLLQDFEPIGGARETIEYLRKKEIPFLYLTNTTLYTMEEIHSRLKLVDPVVTLTEILSPSRVAREILLEEGRPRRLCLPEKLRAEFAGVPEGEPPETIVLADLQYGFTYDLLSDLFRHLFDGAQLLALHKNRYWQYEGAYHLDLGPFVSLLEYGAGIEARVVGKPSQDFFNIALALLGSEAGETWMVGDDVENDVGGAQAAGIRGVLVRTGKYHSHKVADSGVTPRAVIDSIRDLPTLMGV